MCSVTKVLLLLAVTVCIAIAHRPEMGQRCLCFSARNKFGYLAAIKDIQIYPASPFCDKLEIVVSLKNGQQYCLDPRMKRLTGLLAALMKKKRPSPTPRPTEPSSFKGSTESSGISFSV